MQTDVLLISAESGTSMATNLAAASSGASFSITIGSGTTSTYTARLDQMQQLEATQLLTLFLTLMQSTRAILLMPTR